MKEILIPPLVTIIRVEDSYIYGTFGVLLIGTMAFCVTLEPHEFENQKNTACIPPGYYECFRRMSRFGTVYEVKNVPNRSGILFHPGNVTQDTKGCILLGESFGKLEGNRAILNSGNTFTKFLNAMSSYPEFNLLIKEAWA